MFDCVGGTSVGGIIAMACTGTKDGGKTPIANPDELVSIFEIDGINIFPGYDKYRITKFIK